MKEHVPFLAHQIARFGALTIRQMQAICQDQCSRATLYRTLGQLMRSKYVIRVTHQLKPLIGYAATPELFKLIYGESHSRHTGIRARELEHTVACADAMITLSRYSFVTGIATEQEWTPEEIKLFCRGRIPDGIVQITQGDLKYELAVEVETTLKSELETVHVLDRYHQTLLRNMPCVGVLIVAGNRGVFKKYERNLTQLPSEIQERVLLVLPEGLRTLNPTYYGILAECPGQALSHRRTVSQNEGAYISMKTAGYGVPIPLLEADEDRGSDLLSEVCA